MPELPEIETVKLQLQRSLVGKIITNAVVLNPKTVIGDEKILQGKKVVGVRRIAKVLLIDLEDEITCAFHFKMSGQLVFIPHLTTSDLTPTPLLTSGEGNYSDVISSRIVGGHPTKDFVGSLPSSHTRVYFEFDSGKLYFNDQRKFGWIKIGITNVINQMPLLTKMAPEPFDMDSADFVVRIIKSRRPIKIMILDQEVIAGVGNIYANDALWEAGIKPQNPSNKLQEGQIKLLLEKIIIVLNEGIKYGGATMADTKYIDLHGLGGSYQDHFRTYAQAGKTCTRCGEKIIKIILGGRGTFYCPGCQK